MTGLILVVDDLPPNVKLLEAKLTAEYYDVITAVDGFQGIEKAKQHKPDIILLDVMMPGMDGFETCRKIKADPDIAHIPVVMVTALSDKSDRVKGLDAGADDFLTKPVNDIALFARVKSLIRIKVLIDELRLRDQTGAQVGAVTGQGSANALQDVSGAKVLVIDDDMLECKQIHEHLDSQYQVDVVEDAEEALKVAYAGGYDLIILSSLLTGADALREVSHLRSHEETRHVPILILIDEDDQRTLVKGLEMGVNDYLITPLDPNELVVRSRTQIRRKRYQDALKNNYKQSVSMAITDNLTKLFNRHYLNAHLENMVNAARQSGKPLSILIMDMDHFKHVNDTYGHDCGDAVLVTLAGIIQKCIRSSDLAARFGGEEFVVVMPETAYPDSSVVAERIRAAVEQTPFVINHPESPIRKTISIGLSLFGHQIDTSETLLKRADEALYAAKHGGRNRVEVRLPQLPGQAAAGG
ncbi:MAG: PleD family two-component system response regulator [Alphaproteobacteria bacterium]|nr:PleD family two-component system response regulator [Alphaproteobacteria bacterium]